ncbi:MAG: gliding motility-associated C-terminal domain-containing protein, partial [Bacteroidota bacterium]
DRIIAQMQGEFSSLDAAIELYFLPSGAQIAAAAHNSGGLARIGNPTQILSQSGTYLFVVMDNDGSETENYGLSLQFLSTAFAQPIGGGEDKTDDIGKFAEMDAFYFDAVAGDRIIAQMQGEFSSLDAAIELYFLPSGAQIAAATHNSGGLARIGNPTQSLAQSGTYLFVVMDNDGSETENYGLALQFLSTAFAQSIACDEDKSDLIGKVAEMDAYYFEAMSGDRLIAQMQGEFSSLDAAIELYYLPTGAQIAAAAHNSGGLAQIGNPTQTLDEGGTYFLVVMDTDGSETENYGLSIQLLTPPCGSYISCGSTVTGSISQSGEIQAFYFTIEADSSFSASLTGNSMAPEIFIFSPQGMSWTSAAGYNGTASLLLIPAPENGTYFIIVQEDNGDATGGFTLQLDCTDSPNEPCEEPMVAWQQGIPASVCKDTELSLCLADTDPDFTFELFKNAVGTGQIISGTGSDACFSAIEIEQASTFTVKATLKTDPTCTFSDFVPITIDTVGLSITYEVESIDPSNKFWWIHNICVEGGTPPFELSWEPEVGVIQEASFENCTDNIDSLRKGVYRVIVTDANQCTGSVAVKAGGEADNRIGFPEKPLLTPNDDGLNDQLVFTGILLYPDDETELTIVNRYGNILFQGPATTYDHLWDARWKGDLVPPGVYFYHLRIVQAEEGDENVYTGFITVVW